MGEQLFREKKDTELPLRVKQADGEFSGEGIYRKRRRMRDERNK